MARQKKKVSFAEAMNRDKKVWEKSRKVKDTNSGGFPDPSEIAASLRLDDGDSITLPARVQVLNLGVDRNGNGYASFIFIGVGDTGLDDKGNPVQLQKAHFFSEQKIKSGSRAGSVITKEEKLERFFIDLNRIGYESDDDTFDPSDLEVIADDIKKTKPGAKIRVNYRNGYLNVFINGKIEDDELASYDTDDEDEDEDEDETDDNEDAKDASDSDDIEVGLFCVWKAPRMKEPADFEIIESDKEARTCTLKRDSDGKEFTSVKWDTISTVYED